MRISKETFAKLKSRVRGHVQKHGSSYKESGLAAVGGAGANVLSNKLLRNIEFVKNNWWLEPALYAVGGHFVARKSKPVGHGLVGVAGYLLAEGLMTQVFTGDQPGSGTQQSSFRPASQTAGIDAAAFSQLDDPGNAGAWMDANSLADSAFAQLPDASGFRDTDAISSSPGTRAGAGAYMEASGGEGDAGDAYNIDG